MFRRAYRWLVRSLVLAQPLFGWRCPIAVEVFQTGKDGIWVAVTDEVGVTRRIPFDGPADAQEFARAILLAARDNMETIPETEKE